MALMQTENTLRNPEHVEFLCIDPDLTNSAINANRNHTLEIQYTLIYIQFLCVDHDLTNSCITAGRKHTSETQNTLTYSSYV